MSYNDLVDTLLGDVTRLTKEKEAALAKVEEVRRECELGMSIKNTIHECIRDGLLSKEKDDLADFVELLEKKIRRMLKMQELRDTVLFLRLERRLLTIVNKGERLRRIAVRQQEEIRRLRGDKDESLD